MNGMRLKKKQKSCHIFYKLIILTICSFPFSAYNQISLQKLDSLQGDNKYTYLEKNLFSSKSTTPEQAIKRHKEIIAYCSKNRLKKEEAFAQYHLFYELDFLRKHDTSFDTLRKSIKTHHLNLLTTANKLDFLALLSFYYLDNRQTDSTLRLIKEIEKIEKKHHTTPYHSSFISASLNSVLGKNEKAIILFKKSLKQLDSVTSNLHSTKKNAPVILEFISDKFRMLRQGDSAIFYIDKAINSISPDLVYLPTLIKKAETLQILKRYDEMELILNKVKKELTSQYKPRVLRKYKHRYYLVKAKYFIKNKDQKNALWASDSVIKYLPTSPSLFDKFYAHQLKLFAILGKNDSLYKTVYSYYKKDKDETILKATLDLEKKYESTKKKRQIALLQNNIQHLKLRRANRSYTHFYFTKSSPLLASKNIGDFEKKMIPFNFFRPHKAHLINLQYVDSYVKSDGGYILLTDGAHIPLAKNKKDLFLNLFNS